MKAGETDPELRRILMVIYDDDGVLASGAASSPPVGALEVSLNGAAFATATGTFAAVTSGSGEYYYETSVGESADVGYLAFKFVRAGFQTCIVWAPVGDLFLVGETDPELLRMPIVIFDTSEPPQLVAGATVTVASQLKTGLNGNAMANAAGTLVDVGSGLYHYQGVAGDAVAEGAQSIKYEKAGYQTQIAWVSVAAPASGSGSASPPVVTLVSPLEGVVPGGSGGFSSDFSVAKRTPVILDVVDPDLLYTLIIVRFESGDEEVIYRRGAFRGRYIAASSTAPVTDGTRFTMKRSGGWPSGADPTVVSELVFGVDALDSFGGIDA